MTTKQRSMLRSMANTIEPSIYVGKEGVTDSLLKDAAGALKAKELVKGSVGKNCDMTAKDAAASLAEALGAEAIQAIGRKFVLYKRNNEKPVIQL